VKSLLERFNVKWEQAENGCWLWTASVAPNGYARISAGGRSARILLAHRASYELFVGSIPVGMDVDHVCHNDDSNCLGGWACSHRRCVNPKHLALATRSQNLKRSGRTGGLRPGARDAFGRFMVPTDMHDIDGNLISIPVTP
jgi:hypothetical protein